MAEWLSGCGLSCQALSRDGANLAFLARNYLQSYQHLRFLRIRIQLTVNVHLTPTAQFSDMARFHIALALGAATLALLVTFQLISHFGLPALDFLHVTFDASMGRSAPNQYPINSPYDVEEEVADDGTLYKVGVGKADITGYGP